MLLAGTQLIFAQNKGPKNPVLCGLSDANVNNRSYIKISWQPALDTTIIGYKIISNAYNSIDTFTVLGRNTDSILILDSIIPSNMPIRNFILLAFDTKYNLFSDLNPFHRISISGTQLSGNIHKYIYPIDNISRDYFRRFSVDNGKTFTYLNTWTSNANNPMQYSSKIGDPIQAGLYQIGTLNTCDTNLLIGVTWTEIGTGMREQMASKQLLIYPNPATNEINFVFQNASNQKEYSLVLIDPSGRIFSQFIISNQQTNHSLLPLNLIKGIYFIKEINGGFIQKLIIE